MSAQNIKAKMLDCIVFSPSCHMVFTSCHAIHKQQHQWPVLINNTCNSLYIVTTGFCGYTSGCSLSDWFCQTGVIFRFCNNPLCLYLCVCTDVVCRYTSICCLVKARACVYACPGVHVSVCSSPVCLFHVVCVKLLSSLRVVCGCVKRRPDGGLAWWWTFTSYTCMHGRANTHTHTQAKHTRWNTLQSFSFCSNRSHGCMATYSRIIIIKLALIFLQSILAAQQHLSCSLC